MSDVIKILGMKVDRVNMQEALSKFDEFMQTDGMSMIVTPNSEILENATRNEELKDLINSADLVIPDGIGLVKASKIKGMPLSQRVTGIDFSVEALKILASSKKSVFFLGSKPGIAEAAAENMEKAIPGLVVAGTCDGYFKPDEETSVVNRINQSGAEFLLVALGSPKQELFMNNHKKELNVKAAIGVGGSLDVWANAVKRAPKFYQDHGLEWFYRLVKEPSRIGRIARIPVFLLKVIFDKE